MVSSRAIAPRDLRRVGRNPRRSSRISPLFYGAPALLTLAGRGDVRRRLPVTGRVCIPGRIKAGVGFSHTSFTPFLPPSRRILAVNRRRRCVRRIKGLMLAVADQK